RVEDPREAIGGASAATAEPSVPVPEVPYAVVDAADGRGIAGARIIRARDGVVLGVTDHEGRTRVRGTAFDALVFAAEGYLLEHFFDRPAVARQLAGRL